MFSFAFILAITGCKSPTEDVNLIVNTATAFKAPVLFHFSNANTSSTTKPADFTVTVSGKDAALVQMGSGGTDFKASHGFLPLSLKSSASPSPSNPITFNIYAEVAGFAPITKTIIITADVPKVYEVPVVEYANPVAGTLALQSDIAVTAGATTAIVNLTTTPNAGLAEKITISIPSGTQMQDANGNSINASLVKSSIVQYGSSNPAIAESFPGGLNPTNVLNSTGAAIPGGVNFVTAGLLSINMTAGNTSVKKFSKPLVITQELQTGLINFETGVAVKVGDVIPLWSLNETTGQWKSEGTATVALGTGGKLVAQYTISHLSGWNLDWGWYGPTTFVSLNTQLTVNFLPSGSPWVGGPYEVQLQTESGNYLAGIHGYVPQTDFFELGKVTSGGWIDKTVVSGKYGFTLPIVPNITKAKVVIYAPGSYTTKLAETAIFNPTSVGTVNLNVTLPPPPETVNVIANFEGKCTSKPVVAPLNGYIFLYDQTVGTYAYFYLYGGKIYNYSNDGSTLTNSATSVGGSIKVAIGHNYVIETYTGGTYYASPSFVMSKSSFNVPIAAAANLGIATTYDAAANTLLVKGAFAINCN